MRNSTKRNREEEEAESAFISMTDMTVSFLFVIMLLLAYFASSFSEEKMVPRPVYDSLKQEHKVVVAELETKQSELDKALLELSRMRDRLKQSEKKLADAEKRIADLLAEVQRLKDEIKILQERISKLEEKDPLETYLTRAAAARLEILTALKDRLKLVFPKLMIEISAESDALRFQGEKLFGTNESQLRPEPLEIVKAIATRLDEILPAYTFGKRSSWSLANNPSHSVIEAVQIEGHTDSRGAPLDNLRLSTDRSNATFAAMMQEVPDLIEHRNYRGQPVLSVAGYGQMRPVASNETSEGRATNRRIDLRIIMHTPANFDEIETIRQRLQGGTRKRAQ
jgi:outer membrane protein OmpA-like peptidoglycan-associated protein